MTSGSPAMQLTPTAISAPRGSNRMHSDVEPDLDAFRLEDFADRVRDFLVLARHEPRRLFHHRDFRSEAPKDLRELKADVASADDDKTPGQGVEFKQSRVGQRPHLIATRKVGNDRPAADVDEEAFGLEHVVADLDRRGRKEAGVASDDRAIRHAFAARP